MNNQSGYRFYVVVPTLTGGTCIESGWEYKSDARDQAHELRMSVPASVMAGSVSVVSKRTLGVPFSPALDSNWCSPAKLGWGR